MLLQCAVLYCIILYGNVFLPCIILCLLFFYNLFLRYIHTDIHCSRSLLQMLHSIPLSEYTNYFIIMNCPSSIVFQFLLLNSCIFTRYCKPDWYLTDFFLHLEGFPYTICFFQLYFMCKPSGCMLYGDRALYTFFTFLSPWSALMNYLTNEQTVKGSIALFFNWEVVGRIKKEGKERENKRECNMEKNQRTWPTLRVSIFYETCFNIRCGSVSQYMSL